MYEERDYGGVDPHSQGNLGKPTASKDPTGVPCGNCGCDSTYSIRVEIRDVGPDSIFNVIKGVMGGVVYGNYVGCPACPWASKMIAVSNPDNFEKGGDCLDTTRKDDDSNTENNNKI